MRAGCGCLCVTPRGRVWRTGEGLGAFDLGLLALSPVPAPNGGAGWAAFREIAGEAMAFLRRGVPGARFLAGCDGDWQAFTGQLLDTVRGRHEQRDANVGGPL